MRAPDAARFGDLSDGIGQTVAQVHAGARRSRPCRGARRGVPCGSGRRCRATHSASAVSSGSSDPHRAVSPQPARDLRRRRRSCRSRTSSSPGRPPPRVRIRRGLTEPTTVTSTTSGPGEPRDVAARQRDARHGCDLQQAVEQAVDVGEGERRREDERQQREPWRRSHGGDVADVDGERLVADVGRQSRSAGRSARPRRARRSSAPAARRDPRRHGRIVADADDERGRRRREAGGGCDR